MIKLKDILFEGKVKPKQKISKKEWGKIKSFNKHIGQDGTRYVMQLDKRLGTILVPVIVEGKLDEDIGNWVDPDMGRNYMDYAPNRRKTDRGDIKMFYNSYSSSEAKKIVEGKLAEYVQQLRKLEGKLVSDWMRAAKSGAIDFFDLIRGFNTGDIRRGHQYEIKFLDGLLRKNKIQDRFRSYFKGRKGKRRN